MVQGMVWKIFALIETWGLRGFLFYINFLCIDCIVVLPAYLGLTQFGYLAWMVATALVVVFLAAELLMWFVFLLCTYDYALKNDRVIMGDIIG